MEFEKRSWDSLSAEEQEEALRFSPPPMDPGLQNAYSSCVRAKAELDNFELSAARRDCSFMDNEAEEYFLVRLRHFLTFALDISQQTAFFIQDDISCFDGQSAHFGFVQDRYLFTFPRDLQST